MYDDESGAVQAQSIMDCFNVFVSISFEYLVSYIAANDYELYIQTKPYIVELWNASHKVDPISDDLANYLWRRLHRRRRGAFRLCIRL